MGEHGTEPEQSEGEAGGSPIRKSSSRLAQFTGI